MARKYYLLMLLGAVIGLVILFCLCMIVSGKVSLTINGFAVDVEGQLYLGQERRIVVYKDGRYVRTIRPKTSRTYKFTIIEGETLLLSTSTKVYTMDLLGNVLTEQNDEGTRVYNQLQAKKVFVDMNGVKYTRTAPIGRVCICRDDCPIYRMPMLDYIVKLILIASAIALLGVAAVLFVWRVRDKGQFLVKLR